MLAVNEAGRSAASDVVDTVSRSVASPPQLLTAAPSNASGQVRLSWSVPASDGAAAITDYTIEHSPNGTSGWQMINDGAADHDLPHGHRSVQRHPRLLPRFCRQRRRQLSLLQHVLRCSALCGYSSAFADGDADQPVWAGAPGVDRPVVPRWCRDHRLCDPTLDECHIMADDQRRRADHDLPHGHRPVQRHPLLLPSSCPERCGHRTIEHRRQPDPPHGAVRAVGAEVDTRLEQSRVDVGHPRPPPVGHRSPGTSFNVRPAPRRVG